MKWVGTTEAAALLRQFGIRARIVDFKGLLAYQLISCSLMCQCSAKLCSEGDATR